MVDKQEQIKIKKVLIIKDIFNIFITKKSIFLLLTMRRRQDEKIDD